MRILLLVILNPPQAPQNSAKKLSIITHKNNKSSRSHNIWIHYTFMKHTTTCTHTHTLTHLKYFINLVFLNSFFPFGELLSRLHKTNISEKVLFTLDKKKMGAWNILLYIIIIQNIYSLLFSFIFFFLRENRYFLFIKNNLNVKRGGRQI